MEWWVNISHVEYKLLFSYANPPIIWCSKLMTEIALSITESKYIALSQLTRDTIPLMELFRKLNEVVSAKSSSTTIHCTIFEENTWCIDMAETTRVRPRTKHILLKYHHFISYVKNPNIHTIYRENLTTRGYLHKITQWRIID